MANPTSVAPKPAEPNFIDIGGGLSLDYTGVQGAPKNVEEFNIRDQLRNLDNREEASKLTFVAPKDEGELGLQRAYFGAFNKAVLYLPDAAINTAMRGLESAGILKAPQDPAQNRDFLERTFNAANFKQKEQILGFLKVGVPKTEMLPSTTGEKIASAAGTTTSLAIPTLGATSRIGKTAEPVFEGTKLISKGTPYSTVQKDLIRQRMLDDASLGNIAQKTLADILTAYQRNPVGVAAAEVVGGAVGGGATEAEKELTPLRTPSGQPIVTGIPGLLAGMPAAAITESPKAAARFALDASISGITGLPLVGGLIRKGANKIYTDMFTDTGAQESVRRQIQPIFESALENAKQTGDFERTVEILKTMNDFGLETPKLSAAEQLLDTPLAVTQTVIQKGAKGQEARENVNRIQTNIRKAYDFARKVLVGAEDVPLSVENGATPKSAIDDFMAQIEKTQRARAEGLVTEQEALDQDITALAQKFPGFTKEEKIDFGNKIRDALLVSKQTKKQELIDLEKELGLDQMGVKDFTPLKTKVSSLLQKFVSTKDLIPDSLRRIASDTGPGMTFADYRALRDEIGGDLGHTNPAFTDALSTTKQELDQWAEQAFGTGYQTWKKRWQNEYEVPYQTGIVKKVTAPGAGNRPAAPRYLLNGEAVANEILNQSTKNPQDVANYVQLLKLNKDDLSLNDLRNVILDKIYDKAVDKTTNMFKPTQYTKMLDDYQIVLKELNLYDSLLDNKATMEALASRQANLSAREKQIKEDQISKLLSYTNSDKGYLSAAEVIDDLLKNPKELGKTFKQVVDIGDESLTQAFRKATFDRVLSNMDNSPDAFADAIINNKDSLQRIMSPEEFDKYLMVNDLLHRIRFAEKGKEGSGTDFDSLLKRAENYIGTRVPTVAAYYRAMMQSKQSPMFLGATLATRFISARQQRAFDAMHKKAMDGDMQFINDLATSTLPSGGAPRPVELRLRGAMFSAGVPSLYPVEESPMIEYELDDSGKFVPASQSRGTAPSTIPNAAPSVQPVQTQPRVQPNVTVTFPESDTSPNNPFNQPPPAAPFVQGRTGGVNYQSLFPNDPLGAAISNRGMQQ